MGNGAACPPSSFQELFEFYHGYVKPLYADASTENALPQEVLFELNAAHDHISRHWIYAEAEQNVVDQAFRHLKRACLDMFKLRVKEARRQYDELCRTDMDAVDNGEFALRVRKCYNEMRTAAQRARRNEGSPDTDVAVVAFELWENVYAKCIDMQDLYNHPKVRWARRRGVRAFLRQQWIGFLVGVCASIVAYFVCEGIHSALAPPTQPPVPAIGAPR